MNSRFPLKRFMFGLMALSILSLIAPISSSFASLDFSSEINLSSTATNSSEVKIVEDGNIYVIWKEGADVFFKRSTDDGATFDASENLSNTSGTASKNPQIVASGSNVSVVWNEGGEIKIKSSTDSGSSFGSVSNLSNNVGTSELAQIAMSGSNIFVVWHDTTDGDFDILFTKSTSPTDPFDAPINLSSAQTLMSVDPQISADGSDVFVVWSDDTPNGFTNGDVLLSSSSDTGASFPSLTNLSSTSSDSRDPKIAVSGNNVHVVWVDPTSGNSQVNIISSTDNGASFGLTTNLSNSVGSSETPQISVSGTDVHVVWKEGINDGGEIQYVKSTDSGSTFDSVINLSENDGSSTEPQISVSGANVYVIWKDESFGTDTDSNILLRSSGDGGSNFASFQQVSDNTGISNVPQLDSSGADAFIAWVDDSVGNKEIFFRTGSVSSNIINFDSSQYNIGQSPTITVTDSSAINSTPDETKSAVITSDSDGVGISLTLTEDADTGVFTDSFTLTSDSSSTASKTLHVEENDVITATVGSTTGSASIRTAGISFDFAQYGYGDIAQITVTDSTASGSVPVTVTSDIDTIGIPLQLSETEEGSGIFTGNLIFMVGSNFVVIDQTATICIGPEPDSNRFPLKIDHILTPVTSTSDPDGIILDLEETGVNTAYFDGTLSFSSGDSSPVTIHVEEGDFFKIDIPTSDFPMRGMVLPNDDPSNGAITVSELSAIPQCTIDDLEIILEPRDPTVTATYESFTDSAEVFDTTASGGGGGGLVRPSLVVNALAGISGGGSAYSSPTLQLSNLVKLGQLDVPSEIEQMIYNHDSSIPLPPMSLGLFENFDYPMIINDKGFVLSGYSTTLETQTLEINTPYTIKFLFYESDKIQHFSLYTNLRDANSAIHQSDTQIQYNDGQEIQVIDPNGFFKDVSFTLNEIDGLKKEIVLEITFAKEMATTDIIVRSWDPFLNSFDTYILKAIKVEPSGIIESLIPTYEEPVIENLQSQTIPIWIKNNAAWWSEQQISDSDFVSGIEYLIKKEIINVSGVEVGASNASTEIPDWIKYNAGWWADSLITDDDFIGGIQWLVANGVIQL